MLGLCSRLHSLNYATRSLFFITILANSAYAFFPSIWRESIAGNIGVSHEQMTRDAYTIAYQLYFPDIPFISTSMIAARKAIAQASSDVDKLFVTESAPHFDGETFDDGQRLLHHLVSRIMNSLDNDNITDARVALGQGLHSVQDFYSHSNWIELGNYFPHPLLGRNGTIDHASFQDRTCNSCFQDNSTHGFSNQSCPDCQHNADSFTKLTSGYYFGEDSLAGNLSIPSYKCHHGKQSLPIAFTPY
jgi:hypothetical protein